MGAATSVKRADTNKDGELSGEEILAFAPGFDLEKLDATEVAAALAADDVLHVYAERVVELGMTGADVELAAPHDLAARLGVGGGAAAARLASLVAAAKVAGRGDDADEHLDGQLGMMKLIRASLQATEGRGGAAASDTVLGVEAEDTPREEEGGRVAPEGAAAHPGKGARLSNAALRKSAADRAAEAARAAAAEGDDDAEPDAPASAGASPAASPEPSPKKAPPPRTSLAHCDLGFEGYGAEAARIENLKYVASNGEEDSIVARIIEEVSGDYDGTDRDEFEALFAKFDLFQAPGMHGLRDQLFAMFDRDGDGKIAVDEMAGALAIFHSGDPLDRLRLIFRVYDVDASGSVERDELGRLMRSIVVDTRKMVKAALEWEQELVAAVGADLSSTKIDAHVDGDRGGRVSLVEVADVKKASKKKGHKKKKAKKKKVAADDGLAKAPSVKIKIDGAAGSLDLSMPKEELLKLLDDDDATPEFEARLLDALVDDCLSHNDLDHDNSLSFEEFSGWAGGSKLVEEMISHLHVFDSTPWHDKDEAKKHVERRRTAASPKRAPPPIQ